MPRYAAFISYAHGYRYWVKTLQENIELGLAHHGRAERVFLDDADLASGRSWVGQLDEGLGHSERFILVLTPEALASAWAQAERDGFLAQRSDWRQGGLQLAYLVHTPLGPFLESQQYADFREHDETKYRGAYRELLGGLLGRTDNRNPPEAPPGLEIPPAPDLPLPPALRTRLIDALAPELGKRRDRVFVQTALDLKWKLEGFPTPEATASAVLVQATGDDHPVSAALRVVEVLTAESAEDEPDTASRLEALREPLRALRRDAKEPGLLTTYRKWVADEHARMVDYFQQQQELEILDRVFVELEIRATGLLSRLAQAREASPAAEDNDESASATGVDGLWLIHGQRDAGKTSLAAYLRDRPLSIRDLLQLPAKSGTGLTGRWVILGDPGAGKTTLVRHLAASLARDQDAAWVPVYVSLPRALREGGDLLERLERRLEKAGRPASGLRGVLAREGQDGRLLFLLDGLDEVPKGDRGEADSMLRHLSERFDTTPIVVTSRPIGYHRPAGDFHEVQLLPFDRQRRRDFLARWFGRQDGRLDEARADEGLDLLSADDGLWELSGNPLYLTLMALILEEDEEPARNRTRLYDQVFDLLLDGRHRPEGEPIAAKAGVRRALRYIGYGLTKENRDAAPQEEFESRLYREDADPFRLPLERVPRWRASMRVFLDDLARRTGIVGPHDGEDADWRFWHRTFREALAAERLEERIASEGAEEVLAEAQDVSGNESGWAEPYALLTARVDDPDALVRSLMAANSTLGLRALATAERIGDGTLGELLELSGDWKERSKVYRRLPEVVGDGDRALRLLNRLRRQTRDGNDLFFLDLAAESVGKRWPDHAAAASKLRAELYDHIPAPDPSLFETIETPHDGRVPLWCEIPAGKHWVGSPEGVGYDFEQPRHEIVTEKYLRIGAVPVTRAQYADFDPEHRSDRIVLPEPELELHPVDTVSWFEAVSFCRWLARVGLAYKGARLPDEEEWEAACRAGTESEYWSGCREADLARVGWYDENSQDRTHCVGEKPANEWGLYDCHGNVWEWTKSLWRKTYAEKEPEDDDPTTGGRVIRGGSFLDDADWACSAFRAWDEPGDRLTNRGFRVVLSASRRESP